MRDKDGSGPEPCYEGRLERAAEAEFLEPVVAVVAAEPVTTSMAKAGGDYLLGAMPAESMFCVRVNNFDYTLGQIDQFLAGVSPMPMGVSMLARAQLAKLFGSPELNGVKTTGAFAIFGTAAAGESGQAGPIPGMFIAALVPVTDYKKFIGGNPNCGMPDAQGISRITAEGVPPMLAGQVGGFAVISSADRYEELVALRESALGKSGGLASVLDPAEAKRAVGEPIWLYGDVQRASKAFGALVLGKMEETKAMLEGMKASGQAPMMGDPSGAIDLYARVLEKLMQEAKSVSITVNPRPNVLNISETISAVPGTEIAEMFTEDAGTKPENRLLGYLQDGAAVNASGRVTGQLNARIVGCFASLLSEGMSAEDAAEIKNFASDFADVFSGNDAMSFRIDSNGRPPFAGSYVSEISETDKLYRITEQGMELLSTGAIGDFYRNLGFKPAFTLRRGVDTYKGVSIDSARLLMQPADPNSPEGQMVNAMWGGGFDYRWGTVGGLWVCAAGGDVDSRVRRLIDQAKAGGPKRIPSEVKAAMALLPGGDKADFVVTYNFVRLFGMMGAIMPVPMPQLDIPTKSNIALAGHVGGGSITIDVAVPKEHLTEIVGVFQTMAQQGMMQQQGQQAPAPSGGFWTCSMHPQVGMPQKGKCPICGMDLVRLGAPGGGGPKR
jgi:hypothetical protein